jgi:hypothetical protein
MYNVWRKFFKVNLGLLCLLFGLAANANSNDCDSSSRPSPGRDRHCKPTLSPGSCLDGIQTVTVIACDGSISSFNQSCESEKVYSCDSCSNSFSTLGWTYYRLVNGSTRGGTLISNFSNKDECLAAQSADNWCQGNP